MRKAIRNQALNSGFDTIGFAPAALVPSAAEDLSSYLAHGHHGDMAWMQATAERRSDPAKLWSEARSVIVLGVNYAPAGNPLDSLERKTTGTISVYAQGADYHDLIKKRLKALASWVAHNFGGEVKVFVDTAPVMEKPLAQNAGIGWQGKHTNLVSREFGSWLFLGSIFTTLELEPDTRQEDHCGSCRSCLDICPTSAFPAPYKIDARRCISYLTIEHKDHIAAEFRVAIGNRIYGCDDCLAVCPWNKFAAAAHEIAFAPRAELTSRSLGELASLDDATFRALFRGSPIKRIGRDRFVRNVLIAIGNSGDATLAASIEARLQDSSALVRAMAVWALRRLLNTQDFAALASRHAGSESDTAVAAEWQIANAPD